jgi:hypothetical protein
MKVIIGDKIVPQQDIKPAGVKGAETSAPQAKLGADVSQPITPVRTERHFPNFLAAYREYTKCHEASAKVHMWTAISVIAAALERKVWLDEGLFTLFPNLYVFIIGAPGLVKKSTSTAVGVDMLRELDNMNIMAEQLTAAAMIDTLQRSGSKFSHKGQEVRQSSVFCYASELNVFLKEVFGSTVELLTTFYDCQPNDSSKPWIRETKGNGQVKVFGPCLNVLGCSTPTWLRESVPESQMGGGFSSRVIYVMETEPPNVYVPWPKVDTSGREMRKKLVEDLRVIHNLAGEFSFTDEARAFYSDWYIAYMKQMAGGQIHRNFEGYFGRKGTLIKKLAMVASVAESNSLVGEVSHIAKAIAWLEGVEKHMMAAFGVVGKNEGAALTLNVLEFLQKRSKATGGEVLQNFVHDADGQVLERVLSDLQKMRLIQLAVDGSEAVWAVTKRGAVADLRSLRNLQSGE